MQSIGTMTEVIKADMGLETFCNQILQRDAMHSAVLVRPLNAVYTLAKNVELAVHNKCAAEFQHKSVQLFILKHGVPA